MLTKYARLLCSFVQAFWILWVRFPSLDRNEKLTEIQNWSQRTLRIMGVNVRLNAGLEHTSPNNTPQLLVANHVSWLDVLVIQSLQPSVFVAKKEVRAWPVVGAIAQACEVVFVDRGSPSSARKMVEDVTDALTRGYRVAGFPEGTSSEGHEVRLFHANLFEAAIDRGVEVQPIALRYINEVTGAHCQVAAFVGDIGFVASLHKVMCAPSITVSLHIGAPLSPQGHSRRTLAHLSHRSVSTQLEALSASAH